MQSRGGLILIKNNDLSHYVVYYQFSPESQYLDRKSARKKPQELLKHLIAFANADGGQLIIGIEDEKQGNIITGFKDARAYPIDEFKKIDREMRETPLDLSFEEIPVVNHKGEEDLILVISVELSSNRVITAPNDEVYLRQGDETVKLSYEQRTNSAMIKGSVSLRMKLWLTQPWKTLMMTWFRISRIDLTFQIVLRKKFSKLGVFWSMVN